MRWHPPQGWQAGTNIASTPAGGFAGRSVVNALTANGLGGGGPDDNLAQAGHLISQPPSTPVATTEGSELNRENMSSSADVYGMSGFARYSEGVTTLTATDYKRPEQNIVVREVEEGAVR